MAQTDFGTQIIATDHIILGILHPYIVVGPCTYLGLDSPTIVLSLRQIIASPRLNHRQNRWH